MISYDPQLLLTDQRFTRLWSEEVLRQYRETIPDLLGFWKNTDIFDEVIDFEPDYRPETVFYVDSAGHVAYEKTRQVPIERKLTPFVKPVFEGTETGRWRTNNMPPLHDLVANEIVYTYKMTNTVPEFELIDLDRLDFSRIEEHIICVRSAQEAFYRTAIFGEKYEPKPRFTAATKRPPSYHDHDPTKKHRSIKRRRK